MGAFYDDGLVQLWHGDAESVAGELERGSVRTIVTSPPYFGLRDYGEEGQIGAEASLEEYVGRLVSLFRALRDVLADDGTLWLNLGDSYAGTNGASGPPSASSTLRGNGHVGGGPKQQAGAGRASWRRDRAAVAGPRERGTDVPPKNLLGVPWRVAFALQADGWILRSDIVWAKPNPMPESVTDRPTKAHEYVFLFAKSPRYYYDADAIAEAASYDGPPKPGKSAQTAYTGLAPHGGNLGEARDARNKRTVWSVSTVPYPGSHFAVYPPELIRPCILAGSARGDVVLDPFSGSGTTGLVATQEGRRYVGIDLNREYLDLSLQTRFAQPVLDLTGGA